MTTYEKIIGKDFDVADPENGFVPISLSIEGLEGSGKTYFSLMTTPVPVVHINFSDRDATPFLYDMEPQRRQNATLYSFRAKSTEGWTRAEGRESLESLSKIAKEEMEGGKLKGGTFVIDSGSSWWEVMQEVYVAPELERQEQQYGKRVGGLAYGPGNLVVKGIINWLKAQGAVVILTHQLAQEWDANGPIPGRYRARQNNQVPYMVEVQLRLYKTCNTCGAPDCFTPGHIGRTHWALIRKFGKNTGFEGMTLSSPTMSTIYRLYTGRDLAGVPEKENGGGNG